jgi:uncharacterized protein YkwD
MSSGARRRWREPAAVLGIIAGLVALGVACKPTPAPAFGSGLAKVAVGSNVQRQERAMAERLNRDRASRGLPALRFDERLSDVARHHSQDMRDHHFFEHTSPRTGGVDNRLDAAGYAFITARENLSEAPDIERSQDSLLDSPPHFANIMSSDVTHVGIGIVQGGVVDATNLTVTQVFARPSEVETPERATQRALGRLDSERQERRHKPARRAARLMQLAQKHLPELDASASPDSLERASQGIVAALQGPQGGRVTISAQVVPSSEQVVFPESLLETPTCSVGLAMRAVKGEHGRPALQLLLLVLADEGAKD